MLTLNFKEFPTLTTERLVLREHASSDAETLYAMRTNEQVMQYIDRERPKSLHAIEIFITTFNEDFRKGKHLAWVICLKENPTQIIGTIGYWRTNLENYRAEMGYMLLPAYWRKDINPGNDASRQILLKHGFIKEAYFREDYYFNGKFLDSEIYSLLKA
jgi:ribosomal-protein-alanine N-acetyltransferase